MTPFLFLLLLAGAPQEPVKPEGIGPQSWVTNEDYPLEAMRAAESGTVSFRLDVDAAGAVTGCTVTASSGSARLDQATCDILTARARFAPARDTQGRPIASTWSSRFRWVLPEGAGTQHGMPGADALAGVPDPGALVVRFELTRDGRVAGCSAYGVGGPTPGGAHAACLNPDAGPYAAYLRRLGPRYRSVTVASGAALGVGINAVLPPLRGELLLRRAGELAPPWTPQGKPLCRTVVSVGEDAVAPDVCAQLRAAGQAEAGTGPPGEQRLVFDFAVRGVRR
ncbi:MAG TPA: energy transducer TonB [Allosphingosinicella sp.]|jgi:protein TonB